MAAVYETRAARPPEQADEAVHPEVARRRRPVGVRVTLRSALVWAVLATCFVAAAVTRWPLWAVILVVVVGALGAFVTIHGSTVSDRIAARWRHLRRRRRGPVAMPGTVIDVDGCGVRQGDGFELVSAIELTADLSETRLRDGRAYAADTVPLDLLATMMTQYGLEVDIDVSSAGRRVPPGPAYRASYAQGVRFYSAMAQRSTWLVLRVNTRRNLEGIVRRGPSRTAGPKALMAATRRLEQRLRERRIRARVLPAAELADLAGVMTFGADPTLGDEQWTTIEHGSTFATTYFVDPVRMSTERLDRWWGLDSDGTAVVLRLRRVSAHAPVDISGLVRYDTSVPILDNLDDALIPLPGRQAEAARATLPGGGSSVMELPSAPLTDLAAVAIPVGPAGPVWGLSGPDAVALPLFDASPVPETVQVEFATDLVVVQLVLLRSVGAGASVAVHTDRPAQWATLAGTLADPARFRIVDGADRRPADITVFDGVEVDAVPERTLLTVRAPGAAPSANADVVVAQRSPSTVTVAIAGRAPFDVALNATDEELRYSDVVPKPPTAGTSEARMPQRAPRQVPAPPRLAQAPVPVPVPVPQAPQAPPQVAPVPPVPRPAPPQPQPRPVRPMPAPPYERGTGAQRKLGGDRWVRPSKDSAEGGPSRRLRREPGAPRWAPPSDQTPDQAPDGRPTDEPPTSR